jgi:hypothetical protein
LTFDDGSSDTFPDAGATLYLENASGTVLASSRAGYGDRPFGVSNGVVTTGYILPSAGTYNVVLQSSGDNVGSVNVLLNTFTDTAGTIAFNASTTVSAAYPGQTTDLTFSGTAGQVISLTFDGGSSNPFRWWNGTSIAINNASGTALVSGSAAQGQSPLTYNYVLPADGTYSVFFNPGDNVGSVDGVTLTTYTNITGTIASGVSTTVSSSYPGQMTYLTFSATEGENVSLSFDDGSSNQVPWWDGASLGIENASGTVLGSGNAGQGQENGLAANITVPADGTYTVFFNPGDNVISVDGVTLNTFTNTTGTITPNTTTTMSNTVPGQTEDLTFTGTAGQTVSLVYNPSTYTYPFDIAYLYLKDASGDTLADNAIWNGNGIVTTDYALPADGTYHVFLNPNNSTGSVDVYLQSP